MASPDERVTSYAYDLYGNLARFRDPEGNLPEYFHDSAGRMVASWQWDDTYETWEQDVMVYGNVSGCGCGRVRGGISASYHYSGDYTGPKIDYIQWKTLRRPRRRATRSAGWYDDTTTNGSAAPWGICGRSTSIGAIRRRFRRCDGGNWPQHAPAELSSISDFGS